MKPKRKFKTLPNFNSEQSRTERFSNHALKISYLLRSSHENVQTNIVAAIAKMAPVDAVKIPLLILFKNIIKIFNV